MLSADGSLEPRLGRFRVLGRIARGGMAEIFIGRPEDPEAADAGAEVALKRLLPELRHDREFVEMFRDEANLASRLDHPNVVRIYEVGDAIGPNQEAVPFIAMELLRGVNLRDLLARLQENGDRLPVELVMFIAVGALRGLEHAHAYCDAEGESLQIVHRDVSPQNVILTYDGAIKLVDFGVAKAKGRLHETRAGLIKGKFAYMAPEQVDGLELDCRSDLFALAEVIYELSLHHHPFYATSDMEVLRKILDEDPPHPREIDPSFPTVPAQALLRALAKRREDRFPSAAAMANVLAEWLRDQPRRATSSDLATFVRQLFLDRRQQEERARRAGDTDDLVRALQVGRSAPLGMAEPPAPLEGAETDGEVSTLLSFEDDEEEDTLQSPVPAEGEAENPGTDFARERAPRPESVRVGPAAMDYGPRIVPSERAVARDPAESSFGPGTEARRAPATTSPRWDLIVFITGLLALVGALIFAALPIGPEEVRVQVLSKPPGAAVWVNSVDTGLTTPTHLAHPSSGTILVELRRAGFLPCQRKLSADDRVRRIVLECQLRSAPSNP